MKPLILAAALATATTAHADQSYTPAPQAVLDATAGEETMDRVLPYMMLSIVAVIALLAGKSN